MGRLSCLPSPCELTRAHNAPPSPVALQPAGERAPAAMSWQQSLCREVGDVVARLLGGAVLLCVVSNAVFLVRKGRGRAARLALLPWSAGERRPSSNGEGLSASAERTGERACCQAPTRRSFSPQFYLPSRRSPRSDGRSQAQRSESRQPANCRGSGAGTL